MKQLRLITVIVDRTLSDKVMHSLEEFGAHFCHVCYGKGTADNELLNILGLDESEKGVILATANKQDCAEICRKLSMTYHFDTVGNGIAFTVRLDSVGGQASLKIMQG